MHISAELQQLFGRAKRVVVLTGAGVSAESGVPTFRGGGNTAVWKGMRFDVISSAEMVERDLPAVWEWFDYRRNFLDELTPNPAHDAIARWQDRFAEFTLVTQNIDGLHQKAGSRDVIELHGNIRRARCIACGFTHDMAESKRPDANAAIICGRMSCCLVRCCRRARLSLRLRVLTLASCVLLSARRRWSIRRPDCRRSRKLLVRTSSK